MMYHRSLASLTLVLMILVGANHLAAWTIPTGTPPTGNVAAPVNVGPDTQTKIGPLGVTEILANAGTISGTVVIGVGDSPEPDGSLKLDVNGSMGADKYCNEDGGECYTTRNMFGGMFAETTSGTSTCASSNYMTGSCSCPSGFSPKILITGLTGSASKITYCSPTT